jgi:5-methyltetrahydrofolate--homocysteine methyltransferase
MGTVTFEEAYELFRQQAILGEKHGADMVLLETFSDLYEMKAAVLAVKENTDLPVIASMTYQEDGRTFVGCDPVSAALTLSGLGVAALGVNCSLGPAELEPVVEKLLRYSRVPVIIQANAGLPQMRNGETIYAITPEDYAQSVAGFVRRGVRLIGGCCGTDPRFIAALKDAVAGIPYVRPQPLDVAAACSGSKTIFIGRGVTVIGERINPTGKKKLKAAIQEERMDYIVREAIDQAEAGADALDVNMGLPTIDEAAMMKKAVKAIQSAVSLPLQIDSADPAGIEAGLRVCNGRPIINSVNGKQSVMDAIFPIAQKYGALVVGLTLDENGIPPTAEGRAEIAARIIRRAADFGIPERDLLIDCLVLTASAQQEQVLETLRAIRLVKSRWQVGCVLGVSNVSFGLPARETLNATFLAAALGAGLDAPILNPLSARYREIVETYRVLNGEDRDATRFIKTYGQAAAAPSPAAPSGRSLYEIIVQGRREEVVPLVKQLLQERDALDIINHEFIPALGEVGEKFGRGELFLPQLMQSAEAVTAGFAILREHMSQNGGAQQSRGRILLATVKGDIHDIGKNIVKMILESHGYDIIDLGKDVETEAILEAVRRHNIRLIGLSALMTTTVQSMKDTIAAVRAAQPDCAFMVGGAVLTPTYAEYVGADYYAKDAMEGVAVAGRFFAGE